MRRLYVAWQNEETREWIPVAILKEFEGRYSLQYTRGASRCKGFSGLGRMVDLEKIYYSSTLFPFFQNRVISKSRPEYKDYLNWLGLNEVTGDPLSVLSVTGGLRATDSFELIPAPHKEGANLVLDFFPRGLRHMPLGTIETISSLIPGTRLYLLKDIQNPIDPYALLLRSDAPNVAIGYVPRYYGTGLNHLLLESAGEVIVKVKQINAEAPLDMRLLCSLTAPWVDGFQLLESEEDFLPWAEGQDVDRTRVAFLKTSLLLGSGVDPT
jgi:hypothetical protein